jgi:nucleotide-binding universal stress UspA family protein
MIRIKRILCPIDFSDFSRHAFDRAVAVARCYDAAISVLHVLPVPSVVPAVPYGPEGPGPFGFQTIDRARVLAELPAFLAIEAGIGTPIDYHAVEAPSVHKEILLQAQRLAADLVVVGTHGRSGFDRLILGSVAEKVLRTSEVPVLTVPPHVTDVAPMWREPFRRIVLATDFSVGSEAALRCAASLAQHAAARLTLVHVVEPIPVRRQPMVGTSFDVSGYVAQLEKEAIETLRESVPAWVRLGCETDDVVVKGKAYVEILRVAAERQADLIVLAVHGRNALDRMVFGSTTEHIVRRATCPVLTVRQA